MRRLTVLLMAALACSAFADGKFGPEWTLTNDDLIEASRASGRTSHIESPIQAAWLAIIKEKCRSCDIDGSQVTVDGTFHFNIGTDPFVFEINASPLTVAQTKKYAKKIQSLVFDAAKEAGLYVHNRLVGGHIHLDKQDHFAGNDLHQRNFLVDLFNNSEIFMGALSHDYMNAPPFAVLADAKHEIFERLLKTHDRGGSNFQAFVAAINSNVYGEGSETIHNSNKYQAVNLNHSATIEIRGFQPQSSAKHYLAMITLLERRIQYLKKFQKPIPYQRKDYRNEYTYEVDRDLHTYTTKLDPNQIIATYRKFVEESGLDWNDYKGYLADPRLKAAAAASTPSKAVCKSKLKKKKASR